MGPFEQQVETAFSDAVGVVRKTMRDDDDLRRTYHDNVAMAIYDNSRLGPGPSNDAAEAVMSRLFDEGGRWTPWGWGKEVLIERESTMPIPQTRMSGELRLSDSGWMLLDVPNKFVEGVFATINEPGITLPLSDEHNGGKLNAHISVLNPDDVEAAGGEDKVKVYDGHRFHYQIGPLKMVVPQSDTWAKVWYVTIVSPELEDFREALGLSRRPRNDEFDFHVTVAILPKGK